MEQHVLPRVPVRHWICSLPWGLRALLGYDRALAAQEEGQLGQGDTMFSKVWLEVGFPGR